MAVHTREVLPGQHYRWLTAEENAEAERHFGRWGTGRLRPSEKELYPIVEGKDRRMSLAVGQDEFTPELLRAAEALLFPCNGCIKAQHLALSAEIQALHNQNPGIDNEGKIFVLRAEHVRRWMSETASCCVFPKARSEKNVVVQEIRSVKVEREGLSVLYRLSRLWIGDRPCLFLGALLRAEESGSRDAYRLGAFDVFEPLTRQIYADLFEYRGKVCAFFSERLFVVDESWGSAALPKAESATFGAAEIPFINLDEVGKFSGRPIVDKSTLTPTLLTASSERNSTLFLRRYGEWDDRDRAKPIGLEVLDTVVVHPRADICCEVALDPYGRILVRGSDRESFFVAVFAPDFRPLGFLGKVPCVCECDQLLEVRSPTGIPSPKIDTSKMNPTGSAPELKAEPSPSKVSCECFTKHQLEVRMFAARDGDEQTSSLGVVFCSEVVERGEIDALRCNFAKLNYPSLGTSAGDEEF